MKKYLNTTDQKRVDEVVHKAMVVGMVKMMRRTIKRIGIDSPENKPLIEVYKKNLTQLLQEVETLDF
jgi:hypothetical protein